MPQWFWWAYDSVNTKAWHVANIRADTRQGGQITVRIGNTELVNSSRTWLCWPADFIKNYPPCRNCQCIQKYPIVWLYHWLFLSRVSTLTRDIDITILSVRPSVRNVPVSDENGLTYRHSFFSPYGSPIILPASNIFTKFRRFTPCGGAKYRWGIKISRFSTNKSLYVANDTWYRHSYYGRQMGTRTRYQMLPFPITLNEP